MRDSKRRKTNQATRARVYAAIGKNAQIIALAIAESELLRDWHQRGRSYTANFTASTLRGLSELCEQKKTDKSVFFLPEKRIVTFISENSPHCSKRTNSFFVWVLAMLASLEKNHIHQENQEFTNSIEFDISAFADMSDI